jgi:phospholipid/cholesterol/gamma-HCH transport system substrate-binding protein
MENTIKVGIFATIALAALAYLILRAEDIRLFAARGERYYAQFESVAGLDDQSSIRVAGVRVGRVDGIELRGSAAFVRLLFEQEVALHQGARAEIKNLGLLGDKYVEIVAGPEGAALLEPGSVIPGSAGAGIDQMLDQIGEVSSAMQSVAGQLAGDVPVQGPLGQLIVNLDMASSEIRALVAANRESLDATVDNFELASAALARELPRLSQQLQALLAEVQGVVGENRGNLRDGLENVEVLTSSLQTSVDNLNDITTRMNSGEGTIGKLINTDEAHDELVAALDSVQGGVESLQKTLGRVDRIQLELAMQGYYLQDAEATHGQLAMEIDPNPEVAGQIYRVAVVDEPGGRLRTKTQTFTVTRPDGSTEVETVETETREDDTSLSALFGFPVGERYRLWAGIVESKFGVQVDYKPVEKFNFSVEAFDFERQGDLDPHVRLSASWQPHKHFFLLGGYDDPLVSEQDSLFLGVGIRWRDDDLKYLLGSIPSF